MLFEEISRIAQLNLNWIDRVANTASKRYRTYEINKRDGGKRIISQPSKALKALQRLIVQAIISKYPIHPAAAAYRTGLGIRQNAERHLETRITIRLDIENYFPTFDHKGVRNFLYDSEISKKISLDDADIERIVKKVCKDGHLTIGAPSSPSLTNAMMYDIDDYIHKYCEKGGYIYSRYADDIYISAKDRWCDVKEILQYVGASLKKYKYAQLKLNEKKTAVLSKKYRRVIAGVTINSDGKLSLGRNKKKEIKSRIYSIKNGNIEKGHREKNAGINSLCLGYRAAICKSLIREVWGK